MPICVTTTAIAATARRICTDAIVPPPALIARNVPDRAFAVRNANRVTDSTELFGAPQSQRKDTAREGASRLVARPRLSRDRGACREHQENRASEPRARCWN